MFDEKFCRTKKFLMSPAHLNVYCSKNRGKLKNSCTYTFIIQRKHYLFCGLVVKVALKVNCVFDKFKLSRAEKSILTCYFIYSSNYSYNHTVKI